MANIGIFDSGIGGITFLKQARQCLPNENFVYFADAENVPYGTKTTAQVRCLVARALDFLCSRQIKILVLACNTATSAAGIELRSTYPFPILGMEPAVKPALAMAQPKKVLLLSTSLTMREDKLRQLMRHLDAGRQVDTVALDELVPAAEQFEFNTSRVRHVIRDRLSQHPMADYGAIVLGCTHFIFYKNLIEQLIPATIKVLDGNQGTLNNLVRVMETHRLASATPGGQIVFYSSGRPDPPKRVQRLMALIQDIPN